MRLCMHNVKVCFIHPAFFFVSFLPYFVIVRFVVDNAWMIIAEVWTRRRGGEMEWGGAPPKKYHCKS